MAASPITPPPGFELEQPQAQAITPPPGFELESANAPAAPPTADEFKRQAWSQAGQSLKQGHILDAAKSVGSLFTEQNPSVKQVTDVLHAVLPKGSPPPERPAASIEEWRKLPKEKQDAYNQAYDKWRAESYGQSMSMTAGFMSPGQGVQAASDAINAPGIMKQNAGKLFESVANDANTVPVNLTNSHDAALKLMDWQRKTQLGPTLNKFLNRITSGNQGPMTYEEGRDFYQLLSKMSADESMKMAPPVKFQVQKLAAGLKQDLGDSAGQVGRAADYYKAMGDYAHAAKLQEWYEEAKKIGINMVKYAIPTGAAGYLAKKGIDVATEK